MTRYPREPIEIVNTITPNKKQRLVDEYGFQRYFNSLMDGATFHLKQGFTNSAEVLHAHAKGMHGAAEALGLTDLALWCEKRLEDL